MRGRPQPPLNSPRLKTNAKLYKLHSTENSVYVLPEMKLRGHIPNSYIHVCVSDLCIPRIGLHILLQPNRQAAPENIHINRSQIHECGNWETEHYFCFGNNEAVQFHFWEYINRNQTFILDSHRHYLQCVLKASYLVS